MHNITEATDQEVKDILSHSDIHAVHDLLGDNGFKMIGRGTFSDVYHKKGYKRAIKVTSANDEDWIWYAKYCNKNKNRNPYMVKVYYVKEFPQQYTVVTVVEKLKDRVRKLDKDEIKILSYFQNIEMDHLEKRDLERDLEFEKKYKKHKLFEILFHINDKYFHWNWPTDINQEGNLMVRPSNNHLVLSDPIGNYANM